MSNQTLNLVNNIVINAESKGVAKLILDNDAYDGKHVVYNGFNLISFGSYSYLGLEVDDRLKEAAIQAILAYGIQYPSSRIYSSLPIYKTLNGLLEKIFNSNVVLTTSLSLGHMGVMPVVVGRNDLLILDQHVHSSVQDAAQRIRAMGVSVTIVRHNDLEDLEQKIIQNKDKYDKVWYAIDGIYSMFGDTAPIRELEKLLNKYQTFHVYADDAHGVSSFGKNGCGWVLNEIELHSRLILTTGMAKAFGTMGGVFVIPDHDLYEKVKNCTGSLIFSGPHPIPIIGASIKSAEIHLTTEIYERQFLLQEKIKLCSHLLKQEGIPDISDPRTPIFFVAVGQLNAGYNLVRKMIESGFLTNLASFPAVSESCTGVRFTITLHHSDKDIIALVNAFKINYPKVLREENITTEHLRRSFRKVPNFPIKIIGEQIESNDNLFQVKWFNSIHDIDTNLWDSFFKDNPCINSATLKILERTFCENKLKQDNWIFYYLLIVDQQNTPVLATFYTVTLFKEDMLSPKNVSVNLEQKRLDNDTFLSSEMMMMGTQITEGNHLFLNRENSNWEGAFVKMIKESEFLRDKLGINTLMLRDFSEEQSDLAEVLRGNGFLKLKLPDTHILNGFNFSSESDFLLGINKKRRQYLRNIVLKNESNFEVSVRHKIDKSVINDCYKLYKNVNEKSFEINAFNLPETLFINLLDSDEWELLTLNLVSDCDKPLVAMMLCHVGIQSYTPLFVGLNYEYLGCDIYPQILWKTIRRANELNKENVQLGFTASQNKRKFGAMAIEKYGFVKSKDNYNQMLIQMFE